MAIKVIDKAAQREVEVSAAEAQAGIAEGRYGVQPGTVRVARGLDTGSVDAAQILDSLSNGWRIVDDDEASKIQMKREETDASSQILAGVEAFGAGASLGLSTLGLETLGVDPERMRLRREAAGPFATAAELGGGLAAIVGTGGGSLAARGAVAAERGIAGRGLAALGAPTRAVEGLGQMVERGVAGALGTGRMARVVAPTARGATEAYFAGAGAQIDENVLGQREQTAESIFVDGRLADVLFGGAIGAGLPIAFEAARGAGKISQSAARRVLGRATGAPGGEAGDLVGREITGAKGSIWDRDAIAETIGGAAERVAPFADARSATAGRVFRGVVKEPQRWNDILSRRSEIEEAAAVTVRDDLSKVRVALDDARIASQGDSKLARIAKTMGEFEAQAGPAYVRAAQERIGRRLKFAEDVNARTGFTSYDANALRKMRALMERLEGEVKSVTPKAVRGPDGKWTRKREPTATDGAIAFGSYDRFKRDLGQIIRDTGGFSGKPRADVMSGVTEANGLARSLYADARELLENSAVWGKGASTIQKELNETWSRASTAAREFTDEASGTGLSRILNGDGTVNMMQALRLVRQYNRVGGESVVNALDDVLEAQLDHLRVVRKHYDLTPEIMAKIDAAESGVAEFRRKMAQQAKDAGDLSDFAELRGAESNNSVSVGVTSNIGTLAGGILGSAVGGPLGAVGGMVAGSILRPATAARTLASLLSMAERVGAMRGAATGGMLKRVAGPAAARLKSIGQKAERGVAGSVIPISYATAKERRDRVDRARHEVALLATRPDAIREKLERSLHVVNEVAPGTAGEIGKVAQRAAMFLASKTPATYSSPFSGRPPIVDPAAADRYLRYVEAVEHPLETLALIDSGHLSPEHVEAIKAVYPQMWQSFQQDLMEALGAAEREGHEVPYRDRLQLATLVDLPTTLTPQQLLAVQAGNAATAAAEQVPQGGGIRASSKESKLSENAMTPSQRVASGLARV